MSNCFVGEDIGVIIILEPWASMGDEVMGLSVKFSGSVKKLADPLGHLLFYNQKTQSAFISKRRISSRLYLNESNYHISWNPQSFFPISAATVGGLGILKNIQPS